MAGIDRIKQLAQDVVVPGVDFVCPICKRELNNSYSGVHSHMRAHAKRNEIKKSEVTQFTLCCLGRKWKNY